MPSPFAALAWLALAAAPAAAGPREPRTLSLEEALRELEARSWTLEQARSRVEEAAGVSRQALAPALPSVTAAGNYTHNSDSAVFARPPGTPSAQPFVVIQPEQVFGVSGGVRVPLLVPSAWLEAAAARSAERGAAASADAVRLALRAALRQAAWSGVAAEEVVAATERAVESAEEQARSAERAVAAGTGVPLAVLQARTEAVKRRSDLTRARADVERAWLAAGVLLGRAEPVRIPVALPPPAAPAAPAPALVGEAQARRPELRAAAEQVAAAERQVTAARLRWLPQLSASGSVFAQTEPLPTGHKDGWRLTVDATWSIFEGGAREGRTHQAEAAAGEARAAAEAQRVSVAQEVEDAARDVGVAEERLRLADDQVKLASEAAATARRGFAGGVSSSLDVLDANDRLYQSEVGLADARARLGGALAALDRAVGR